MGTVVETEFALARDIVREHFGDIVECVVTSLLGTNLSLVQVVQKTGYDENNSLVKIESVRSQTTYTVVLESIILRLLFPFFIQRIAERFGKYEETVAELLFEHGALPHGQILSLGLQRLTNETTDSTSGQHVRQYLQMAVEQLRASLYLEIARPPVIVPSASSEDVDDALLGAAANRTKRRRSDDVESEITTFWGGKRRARKSKMAQDESSAASPIRGTKRRKSLDGSKKKRPALQPSPSEEGSFPATENAGIDDRQRNEGIQDSITEFAPFSGVVELPGPGQECNAEDQVWRMNTRQFLADMNEEASLALVAERIDAVAAGIVRILMYGPKVGIDFRALWEEVQHSGRTDLCNLPMAVLQHYLDVMANDRAHVVVCKPVVTPGFPNVTNRLYVAHAEDVAAMNIQRIVESIVLERFGPQSCRIFRLLISKHFLESKQIGDFAMVPQQETRERLFSMLKEGFVHLQEVPRSQDRTARNTTYLWSVRLDEVNVVVRHLVEKSILNLRIRLSSELAQLGDLVTRAEEEQSGLPGRSTLPLSSEEKSNLEQIQAKQDRLESSILKLASTLATLNFFDNLAKPNVVAPVV